MLYCPNCQLLTSDDSKRCPFCGSKKLRNPKSNDLALLITADESKSDIIESIFNKNSIPYEKYVRGGLNNPMQKYFGKDVPTNKNIFVPYGEIEKCEKLLNDADIVDTSNKKLNTTKNSAGEESDFQEMSPHKRFFWRAVSAILFIIIVWIVVFAADYTVSILKAFLKNI